MNTECLQKKKRLYETFWIKQFSKEVNVFLNQKLGDFWKVKLSYSWYMFW